MSILGNEVLATTTFDGRRAHWIAGTVMPVVWIRQQLSRAGRSSTVREKCRVDHRGILIVVLSRPTCDHPGERNFPAYTGSRVLFRTMGRLRIHGGSSPATTPA